MEEIWKDIPGYEGLYQASNLGKIRSMHYRNKNSNNIKELKARNNNKGYFKVNLNGKNIYIHTLIAKTFISNENNYKEINHKDGNKENNCIDNLEWCNHKDNMIHASKNLKKCGSKKVKCTNIKTGETKIYYSMNSAKKDGFKTSGISRSVKIGILHHNCIWELL